MWLHEVKFDGGRGQLHKWDGQVRPYSKRGNHITFRFPDVVRAVAVLPIGNVNRERWKLFEKKV